MVDGRFTLILELDEVYKIIFKSTIDKDYKYMLYSYENYKLDKRE